MSKREKPKSGQVGGNLNIPLESLDVNPILDLRTNPIHECRVYDKHGKLIRIHTREELIERARNRARQINLDRLKEDGDV